MRWFGLGRRRVEQDPQRQHALLHELRHGFGPQQQLPFADQAEQVTRLLDGDDGLAVASEIVREVADAAHQEMLAQADHLHRQTGAGVRVDRSNYRPLWRDAGRWLRWPLFALPGGLHPYVHVAAAAPTIGAGARRAVRVTSAEPLLDRMFEVLDLTVAGWEFGRVRVDTDAATLAVRLISATRALHDAMSEPPPLPPPVRELMRRNNSVDVLDPRADRVVGTFNPGKTMRETLLA
ncbi:hypothetical protein [Mangrovihabitans endophyticus]|uniref:Uncharacterized protein n=1 Tax=Mangrovihabitans endophyticus TaxID=1751298 RepID=A0A8J3FRV6_9ACTN|nr:hypothetical protein [Mangrovihabitans endophyticus]GGL10009.1 hypothetical protein GCM10012284_50950 [Mangrovihabitans endophyticus]